MICDTATTPPPETLRARLAVLGAGPAGIVIALEAARAGIDTVLLEAGGEGGAGRAAGLMRGTRTGAPVRPLHQIRAAGLGGSSALWTGWCRPLDPIDFGGGRASFGGEGGNVVAAHPPPWPFGEAELRRYEKRADRWLEVGPGGYGPDAYPALAGSAWRLCARAAEPRLFRFSPPTRFGPRYRDELAEAGSLRVLTGAVALGLERGAGGGVAAVRAATPGGWRFAVTADRVVLALGGVENPRLLLQEGLGGEGVGRGFMDHAYAYVGAFEAASASAGGPSRGGGGHEAADPHTVPSGSCGAGLRGRAVLTFGLPAERQRREGLTNAHAYFVDVPARQALAEHQGPAVLSLGAIKGALREGTLPRSPAARLAEVMAGAPAVGRSLTRLAAGRLAHDRARARLLRVCVEDPPDPRNHVGLARRRDSFGRPLAAVHWSPGPAALRTLHAHAHAIGDAVEAAGIGRVRLHGPAAQRRGGWPASLLGGAHPTGGTRMHADPARGVVDPDGRVHGVPNLFVAGSSVFPTSGASNPTHTIVALALRLADALAGDA